MALDDGEPAAGGPGGAARWSAYLDWLRTDLRDAVLALDPAEQRRPLVPSGWSALEMLAHCLHMERRWFAWGFRGEPVPDPWGDWAGGEPGTRWAVADDVTAADLAARLEVVAEGTRAVLAATPLDAVAPPGPRFEAEPPDLEWICFHVVAEYARHLGHLDVALETAPGEGGYRASTSDTAARRPAGSSRQGK